MKRILGLFLFASLALGGVACGDTNTGEPATPETNTAPTLEPANLATNEPEEQAASSPTTAGDCEEFFRFCVTSTLSGAVDATATAGMGGNVDNCAAWAAAGEARILEMPMMQGAGEDQITHALTRIAAYSGPGRYELRAVATEGIPDMFPTVQAAGRIFSYGEGSTAVVTVAADGSGTIEAMGLVEIPSVQVSVPDPEARVDFNMQWTCRDS